MGNNTTLGQVVGVASAKNLGEVWKKQWMPAMSETRTVRMLRVTAVLLADDDGGRATGVLKQGGNVMPKEGLLRNSAIHTKISENYIDDWISLANKQLWVSGADFLLDRANVRYVLEKNTAANSQVCKPAGPAISDLIAGKQKAKGDNPWKDAVLLVCPWGNAAEPSEQGCSDIKSPFIKLAAKYHDFDAAPRFVDGSPVPGNNLLTHELGHFLGLAHNFPQELHDNLIALAFDPTLNPHGVALTEANAAQFNGITKDDIAGIRAQAKKFIATWKYSLEQDNGANPTFPGAPLSDDTPVNLGMGLPACMGDPIGSGNHSYPFDRFTDMTTSDASSFGTPNGDGKPVTETVPLNKDVRLNVMGYWYANVFGQKFSPHQVARMKFAVDTVRNAMVSRTVSVTATVSPTGLEVSENVFTFPLILLNATESMKMTIRKPTQREIDVALAKVRQPKPSIGRRVMEGNHCGLQTKGVRVR